MSVLKKYFDKSVDQCSPVQVDFDRKVNYDADGNEVITWQETDYESIQAANGYADNWSLSSLLKAGIDPAFPISTSAPTRLAGYGEVMHAIDVINAELDSANVESPKE